MSKNAECIAKLGDAGLFEDAKHEERFSKFMESYGDKPFFNKGVCTCMFMSSMDDAHTAILSETLKSMSDENEESTKGMQSKGENLASFSSNDEAVIYKLSVSFVAGRPFFVTDDKIESLSDHAKYVIEQSLKANQTIAPVFA